MGSVLDSTLLHHVCIVLIVLWFLNSFNWCHPVAYFLSLIYLYLVHELYVLKLRKKLQFEEKRESDQRRVLTDSESLRWLNHAIEKIWPICMEEIVSQKILLPIFPWFLKKYKPWTVKDVELQHLYLGRSPPMFTEMRVLRHSNGDDHLVLELGMNFRTADDMSAILGVKLRKRLGFGMYTKLHMLGMHVEGKVLVGVKFLRGWPFISRLRVCFSAPPYFQMTVKPIFTHGLDVTELPGIAGWIDNLLALVFEQTLVEPNMLVVDVEKFVSPQPENWFSVDAKEAIALATVEILEATEMNPSDLNGLADPYVKGQLGPFKFRTRTRKKTLSPKWHEEFKIPIFTWESDNMLVIEVCDKDHMFDDMMGDCCVNINEHRDGQRYDLWLPLKNIKTGRLHLAISVSNLTGKATESSLDEEYVGGDKRKEDISGDKRRASFTDESSHRGSFSSTISDKSPKVADKFDPIDVEGQSETGIWIHHPGGEVTQVWEPRKGKNSKHLDSRQISGQVRGEGGGDSVGGRTSGQNDSSSTDESSDSSKSRSANPVKRGLRKIGSVFRRTPREADKVSSPRESEPSPQDNFNIRASNRNNGGVKLIIDDSVVSSSSKTPKGDEKELQPPSSKTPKGDEKEEVFPESPSQRNGKDMAKSILKHAGRSARELKLSFSRKIRNKPKGELPAESDSTDDESLSSSIDSGFVVPSSAVSPPALVSDDQLLKLKDDIQTENHSGGNSSETGDIAVPAGDKVL
ncbi:C2 domain-containing protein At1g53590-like isoform X2 [Salvia miltiorrhiza]|uniref:C2 domain-containing protein At1g53590-like isoform X2 n=1 Tax=Salvia miltiorrhiza TaxID=226208 RepID=UPI0025AB956F|nr:C2 domain-containing protein At1g53590-like isoform X2 [Salvia miltiorrhiza]